MISLWALLHSTSKIIFVTFLIVAIVHEARIALGKNVDIIWLECYGSIKSL